MKANKNLIVGIAVIVICTIANMSVVRYYQNRNLPDPQQMQRLLKEFNEFTAKQQAALREDILVNQEGIKDLKKVIELQKIADSARWHRIQTDYIIAKEIENEKKVINRDGYNSVQLQRAMSDAARLVDSIKRRYP